MLLIAVSLFLSVGLASCVSTRETYTAEGNMVYSISCKLQSVNACLEEAGMTCGSLGYKQVQKDGSPMPAVEEKPQSKTAALIAAIGFDRKIYVKCGHTYRPEID